MYVNAMIFCFALLGASVGIFGIDHWVPYSVMCFTIVAPFLVTAMVLRELYKRGKQGPS